MKAAAPTELVKRAAVARFLGADAEEVQMMIEAEGLPIVKQPGKTKPAVRVFLPDFHTWIVKRAQGDSSKLRDYAEFKRAFFAAQGVEVGVEA